VKRVPAEQTKCAKARVEIAQKVWENKRMSVCLAPRTGELPCRRLC
jgi:hypothetical protein